MEPPTCRSCLTQQLQIRDDVVDILICQRDEAAQGSRTNRVLRFREIEEPLIVSDRVAERLGAVVVEIGRGIGDAPERRNLEHLRKERAGDDGQRRLGGWRSGVEKEPEIGRVDRHRRVHTIVNNPSPDRIVRRIDKRHTRVDEANPRGRTAADEVRMRLVDHVQHRAAVTKGADALLGRRGEGRVHQELASSTLGPRSSGR